jgi:hypothetical protein
LNYLNKKQKSKKIFADGTTTLFRNEFKHTTDWFCFKDFIFKIIDEYIGEEY